MSLCKSCTSPFSVYIAKCPPPPLVRPLLHRSTYYMHLPPQSFFVSFFKKGKRKKREEEGGNGRKGGSRLLSFSFFGESCVLKQKASKEESVLHIYSVTHLFQEVKNVDRLTHPPSPSMFPHPITRQKFKYSANIIYRPTCQRH